MKYLNEIILEHTEFNDKVFDELRVLYPNMGRTRMSWDWIGRTPVFVYTNFLDHNVFRVRIVLGKRGNQNHPSNHKGLANPWLDYINRGQASKDEVVQTALNKVRFGDVDNE